MLSGRPAAQLSLRSGDQRGRAQVPLQQPLARWLEVLKRGSQHPLRKKCLACIFSTSMYIITASSTVINAQPWVKMCFKQNQHKIEFGALQPVFGFVKKNRSVWNTSITSKHSKINCRNLLNDQCDL